MTTQRPDTTLSGIVEAIIRSPRPGGAEKALIAIEGADELGREIRIENTLKNEDGDDVNLKLGAPVQITVREGIPPTTEKLSHNVDIEHRVAPATETSSTLRSHT